MDRTRAVAAHRRVAAQAIAHVALRAAHVAGFNHVVDHVAGQAHVVVNVADSGAANHDPSQRERREVEVAEVSSRTLSKVRPVTTTDLTLPLREARRSEREAGVRAEDEAGAGASEVEVGTNNNSHNNISNSFKVKCASISFLSYK